VSVERFSVLELDQLCGNVQVIMSGSFRWTEKRRTPWACFVRH
jgi:hypothetical protein